MNEVCSICDGYNRRETGSCCWREGDRDVRIVRGVSVSLSWLFVTAEYVGAAVETERAREDEGALITERQRRGTSCAAEIQLSCPNTEV